MKAAFITPYKQGGAHEPEWAGYKSIGTLLSACLQREGIDLCAIGGFREQGRLWRGARQAVQNVFAKRRYLRFADPGILTGYARQLEGELRKQSVDIALSHGWLAVAHATMNVPLVIHNDAPLVQLIDYYSYYSNIDATTEKRIRDAEALALEKAAIAVYASEWAANGARSAYPSCAEKIHVLPYGPAFPEHLIPSDIHSALAVRAQQPQCELLFFGVDWKRKGGPLAVEIVRRLNTTGMAARLTVVGCEPHIENEDKRYVDVRGFLDASTHQGAQQLWEIMNRSHVVVLPVQAEAFGLVFAEASAFGIPSLAPATGGVTTAVRDGINGVLFSTSDGADIYCTAIRQLMDNRHRYEALAHSSRRDYEERLNWQRIGKQWAELLCERLAPASYRA